MLTTKGVALETAEFGVTCNAVCPGFTASPGMPIKCITHTPEVSVASAVMRAFLLSPLLFNYIMR